MRERSSLEAKELPKARCRPCKKRASLSRSPPPTWARRWPTHSRKNRQVMMRFNGKIPVAISPAFWIFAALIGYLWTGTFLGALIWVGIIFVSVLFHEFGHALTALLFGKKPRIELVALGGLTYHDGDKLPFWKQFFITLNG